MASAPLAPARIRRGQCLGKFCKNHPTNIDLEREVPVKQADALKASEAFIAKLAARERSAERGIFAHKRAAMYLEDVKLVRETLLKSGLDFKRLDTLAKKRNLE